MGTTARIRIAAAAMLCMAVAPARLVAADGVLTFIYMGTGNFDTSVGLSASDTYVSAANIGGPNVTVNGVLFAGSGSALNPSGTGYTTTGFGALVNNAQTAVTGQLGTLLNTFAYNGSTETVTLNNLAAGQTYTLTFYNRQWDATGPTRGQTATTTSGASLFFYESPAGGAANSLNLLRYTFTATGTAETITFSAQVANTTFHLSGFSTEQVFNNAWVSGTNWTTATWSVGQPNAVGANADFGAQASPTTMNLDAGRTVGNVRFSGTNAWTLAGSSTLTLSADVGAYAVLSSSNGVHEIAAPTAWSSSVFKTGTGTLLLSGSATTNSNTILLGSGVLSLGGAGALGSSGTISFGGGTLQFTAGNTTDYSGRFDSSAGQAYVIDTNGQHVTFASNIASSGGSLTKLGSGTLAVAAATTFSGTTTSSAGTLLLTHNLALQNSVLDTAGAGLVVLGSGSITTPTFGGLAGGADVASAIGNWSQVTALTLNPQSGTNTYAGSIADGAAGMTLTKTGSGTQVLSGSNPYSGATTVSAGSLVVANPAALGLASANLVAQGGILDLGGYALARTGTVRVTGGTIQSGTLTNDTVAFDGQAGTVSATLAGSIGLVKTTTGTLTLSGSNAYAGGTQLNGGVLAVGNAGALGTTGTISFGGGTLRFSASNTTDYSGRFSTAASQAYSLDTNGQSVTLATALTSVGGSLAKLGGGTLTLSASNSYTGGTLLNGGVLALGNAGALGETGTISFGGGTLQFSASNTTDYSGRFSTAASQAYSLDTNGQSVTLGTALTSAGGSLAKLGSGTLTLTASNSYTGTTTVSAGSLLVANPSALGAASANLVVQGGILDLGGYGLTRTGTVQLTGGTIQSGTLTNDTVAFDVQAGTVSATLAGSVGLVKTTAGTVTLSGSNAYTGGTQVNAGTLSFAAGGLGASGSVTVSNATLQWASGNTLDISLRLALVNSTTATLDTNGNAVTLATGFGSSSSATLAKAGAGTLTLSASNSYTGGTRINAGTLSFVNGGLGGSGSVTMNGGVLQWATGNTQDISPRLALVNATAATLDTNGNNVTLATGFGGSSTAPLVKAGSGTLTLTASNSFTGGAQATAGVLAVGNAAALGTGIATVNGGTLDLAGFTIGNAITLTSGTLLGSGAVNGVGAVTVSSGVFGVPTGTLNVGAVTVGTTGANPGVTTLLTGSGRLAATSLIVQGNGANSQTNAGYTGSTPVTISSGTLTTTGNVGVGRWGLTFGGSSTVTVSGTIGGGGIVSSADWGALTISGSAVVTATGGINGNTEAWQLNLNGGTLYTPSIQASDRETPDSARLVFNGTRIIATTSTAAFATVGANASNTNTALVGNGGVDIDSNGNAIGIAINLAPSAGSTGGLTKRGAGTLTLTGTNSYTGPITISGGTLQVGAGSTAGSISASSAITNNAALVFNRSNAVTLGNTISGSGVVVQQGTGSLGLSGANSHSGGTRLASSGTLAINGVSALGTGTLAITGGGTLDTAGVTAVWGGNAPFTVSLVNAAVTPQTWGSNVAYAGTTMPANLGTGTVTLTGNRTVTVSRNTFAVGGIAGGFALEKTGTGTLVLQGAGSQAATTVTAGTLRAEAPTALGTGLVTVASGATLDLGSLNQSAAGLSGAGSIVGWTPGVTTPLDGSSLINTSKTYTQLLDFGNGTAATVNGVAFTTAATSGTGFTLTGATTVYNENGSNTGYAQLMNDFYYGGNPGVLTFTGLTAGTSYEAVVYTQVGAWTGRPQNATFTNGASVQTVSNLEQGNIGAVVYGFVASGTSASIQMAPTSAGSFHWFGASLQQVGAQAFTVGDSGTYAFSGGISGRTGLTKVGAGTQTLSGTNTYTGPTTVSAGILQIGAGGAAGALADASPVSVAAGGLLAFSRSDTLTYGGTVSGAGGLTMLGTGTLALTGASTYTGTTTVSGGVLQIGSGGAAGSLVDASPVSVASGATFAFNRSGGLTYGGTISGAGGLTTLGSGTVTLTVASTYTGTTNVNAGTLAVTAASLASPMVNVAGGAALSGTATLNAVTVANAGILTPGVGGVGTLTLSALAFSGSAAVTVGVQAGLSPTSGTTSSLLQVNGGVTTGGGPGGVTFALGSGLASLRSGTYSLLSYTGSQLADVSAFAVSGTTSARQTVSLANSTQAVSLVTSNPFVIWGGTVGGGWSTADSWALSSSGSATSFLPNDIAVFDDSAVTGTVTLSQNVDPLSTTFSGTTRAYTLSSGGAFGITAGSLVKSGPATLTVTTSNSFAGGTTLAAGTLRIGNDAALGTGGVTVTGGTITSDGATARTLASAFAVGGNVTLGSAIDTGGLTLSGTLDLGGATRTVTTPSGVTISGPVVNGGFAKAGSGTLTLSASNSYTGGTQVNGGVLALGSAGALAATGTISFGGGTLQFSASSTTDYSGRFSTAVNQAYSLDTNGQAVTVATALTSAGGSLAKLGSGTLTLSASNTYTGPTTISGGLLQIAASGTGTTLTIPNFSFETPTVAAPGYIYNPTGANWTFSGQSGMAYGTFFSTTPPAGTQAAFVQTTGSFFQAISTGTAGFYRITFQAQGRGGANGPNGVTLQVNGTSVGSWAATDVSQTQWLTYSSTTVYLAAGTNTLAFLGNNTAGGDKSTSIDNVQAFQSASQGGLPSTTALTLSASGAALDMNGTRQTIGSLAGVAGSRVSMGYLTAGGDGTSTTFAGSLSTVSLSKVGSGTLTLTGSNAFLPDQPLAINGGVLALGSAGALGPSGTISFGGGTLQFSASNTTDYSSRFSTAANQAYALDTNGQTVTLATALTSAGGSLTKQGAGTLVLQRSGSQAATTVAAGTLRTEAASALGSGPVSVASGATLDLAWVNQTVAGLSGSGSVVSWTPGVTTSLDGASLINASKTYTQLLDFGDGTAATVNGVAFTTAGTSGSGFILTGATTLYPQSGSPTGYAALMNDFYYAGNPGVLTFTGLTAGVSYEAVLYSQVGLWGTRVQNATFTNGPNVQTVNGLDEGAVGAVVYGFVASGTSASIQMAPTAGASYHWFAASLQQVGAQTLTLGDAGDYVFSGSMSGNAGLTKVGAGSQTLSGTNTYSGTTTVSAGTLQIGSGGTTGSLSDTSPVSVAAGATLAFSRSNSLTYGGTVSGAGGLMQLGSGTLTLTAVNTYTGATTVSAGVLQVGGGGVAGGIADASPVTVAAGATLAFNRSDSLTYGGTVSGSGGLVKLGAGVLTLSAASTYTGTTNVNAGTLAVTAASLASSMVNVAGGATLSGTATLAAVTVATTGILTPGVGGVGTLTLSSLAFDGAATVNVGVQNFATASLLQVNGGVTTAGGSNSVTFALGSGLASLTTGTYTLLSYTGQQFADASAFTVSGSTGARQAVSLANGTQAVNLVIGNAFPIWSGTAGGGWSTMDNWVLNTTGSATSFLPSDATVFDDVAATGAVTLSQNVAPASTTFSGTTLAYTLSSPGGFGITSGALVKNGPATLTITTSNSYAGGTTLAAGTLRIGTNAALGTGVVTVTGGTITSDGATARTLANAFTLAGNVTLGSATDTGAVTLSGTVDLGAATRSLTTPSNVTLSGALINGGLAKSGSGTLTLSGSNTYTGGTQVDGGVVALASAGALGPSGAISFGGGTLQFSGSNTTDYSGRFSTVAGQAYRLDTNGQNVTLGTALTSVGGSLVKLGSGTLTLTAANTFSGTATVSAGALQIGAGGATGSLASVETILASNATLVFNRTGSVAYAGIVSGAGGVNAIGGGTLALSGASTYTGVTTFAGGAVEVSALTNYGVAGPLGGRTSGQDVSTSIGLLFRGGTLRYSGSTAQSTDRAIRVSTTGGATLDASGSVPEATMSFTATSSPDFFESPGTRTLTLTGSNTGANVFAMAIAEAGGATSLVKSGPGRWVLTGTNTYSGTTTITGGTLQIGAGGTSGSLGASTVISNNGALAFNRSDVITLANAISGTGALVQQGAGSLVLTGSNTYTGATTITGGTLQVGAGSTVGSLSASTAITTNAALAFNRSDSVTVANTISGSGVVVQQGTGSLALSGANTHSGGTRLASSGTLVINNASALGTGRLTLDGGTLDTAGVTTGYGTVSLVNAVDTPQTWNGNVAYAGTTLPTNLGSGTVTLTGNRTVAVAQNTFAVGGIAGGFTLEKTGTGTLVLQAAGSQAGTTVSAGTLRAEAAGALGTGAVSVASGATLALGSLNQTAGGLSGDGSIVGWTPGVTTSQDGESLINSGKTYAQLLDFGNGAAATVNGVAFTTAGTSGAGFTLTGATTLFGESGTPTGYAQLMNDFYYNGNPGTLTFTGLTAGTAYEAVLYTQVGAWVNRAQNATFTNGASVQTLNGLDEGAVGAVVYGFVASGTSASIQMTPQIANTTFHWFAASLQQVGGQTLTVGDAGTHDFTGIISGGRTALAKVGSGTQTLSGANSYAGGTTVSAGRLVVGNDSALGSATAPLTVHGGTLDLNGRSLTVGVMSGSAGGVIESGAGPVTLTTAAPASGTFAGLIQDGAGTVALVKDGAGTLTLSGSNGYTGVTTISTGTLALSGAGWIAASSAVVLSSSGATFDISAATGARTIRDLSGAAGSVVSLGGNTLTTLMADDSTTVFDGVIGGSGGFTKGGGATSGLTLTSIQQFTGPATIAAGALVLTGSNLLQSAARIDVLENASLNAVAAGLRVSGSQSLGGYGTVYGDLTFAPGSVLSPGGSVGQLDGNFGAATLSGGMTYVFEVNDATGTAGGPVGWDLFQTDGAITLDGAATTPIVLDLRSLDGAVSGTAANFDPAYNYAWKFLVAGTGESITYSPGWFTVTDNFQNVSAGEFFVARGDQVTNLPNFSGGTSNELYVVYAAAPEPGSLVLAGAGVVCAGWILRRRARMTARRRRGQRAACPSPATDRD